MSREHWIVLVACVLGGATTAAPLVWRIRRSFRNARKSIDRIIGGGR